MKYRGIVNLCLEWTPDARVKTLQTKVRACQSKQMDWWKKRFINSCIKRQTYSPEQEIVIDQIYVR